MNWNIGKRLRDPFNSNSKSNRNSSNEESKVASSVSNSEQSTASSIASGLKKFSLDTFFPNSYTNNGNNSQNSATGSSRSSSTSPQSPKRASSYAHSHSKLDQGNLIDPVTSLSLITTGLGSAPADRERTTSATSSNSAEHKKCYSANINNNFVSARSSASSIMSQSTGDPTKSSNTSNDFFKLCIPSSTVRPGLLAVSVLEAKHLTIPGANEGDSLNCIENNEKNFHPSIYMVLEFDKNEILIDCPARGLLTSPRWDYTARFDVSRPALLSGRIYLRVSSKLDVCLGAFKLQPAFKTEKPNDQWVLLTGGTANQHNHSSQPALHITTLYQTTQNQPLSIEAFDLLKVVGKGSFGKVMQVRKIDTSRIYALKTIRKAHIISRSEVDHTISERTVLAKIVNPFIVPLKFSFQSPEKLYIVLAFVNGGELFHHLQREGRFSVWRSKFYTAELLCALECLHDYNVIYRDLKPENILLDYSGHIALCDFGLCKLNMKAKDKTNTFCGTPEYLAPELLVGKGYTKAVDWWTLGVLLCEMLTGLPPFYDENVNEMYRRILNNTLQLPDELDPAAKDLLTKLLDKNPETRLGARGATEIKEHPFFNDIDWKLLMQKKIDPPFKPSVESAIDTSNFDPEFTDEPPFDSLVDDSHLSETVQRKFANWSYQPPNAIDESENE